MNTYQVINAAGRVLFMNLLWDGASDTMNFASGFGFVSVYACKCNGWQIVAA